MRKWNILFLAISAAIPSISSVKLSAQRPALYQKNGRVDESTLASIVPDPEIQSFDLSPDGAQLALLIKSGERGEAPSWIMIASVLDSRIIRKASVGMSGKFIQGYAPQVGFAADGKLLVVQGSKNVTVLNATTLEILRTIAPDESSKANVPAGILVASESNLAAISYGDGTSVTNYMEKRLIHNEMVDVTTGRRLASWNTGDLPLSIPPNGEYIAVSNAVVTKGVMGIDVIESRSGKALASLSDGFGYPGAGQSKNAVGREIARFISNDDLLLTPDGNRDQSGHDAGEKLTIVAFKSGLTIQEISPEHYGPIGGVEASANKEAIVAISQYLAPRYLTHHWRVPADSTPELLVFDKHQDFKLSERLQLPPLLSLRTRNLFNPSNLRISKDANTVALAEDYGVTILKRN